AVSSTVAIDASSASKRYPLGYPAGYTNQGGPWTIPNRGRPQAIPARPGPARPCPGEWGHPGPRAEVPDRAVVAARRPSGPSPLCRPVAGYRLEQDGGDDHVVSRPVRRWQATGPAVAAPARRGRGGARPPSRRRAGRGGGGTGAGSTTRRDLGAQAR